MNMAIHPEPRPVCPTGPHRHEPRPVGGRCAFHSPGRPGDICGRDPVAVYINDAVTPRCSYRCAVHDRDVAQAEAARLGFRRLPVVTALPHGQPAAIDTHAPRRRTPPQGPGRAMYDQGR